jgi:hypothetical protein
MTYTTAVCTMKDSWWWTEELSETCSHSKINLRSSAAGLFLLWGSFGMILAAKNRSTGGGRKSWSIALCRPQSHMNCTGIEHGPPRWEASYWPLRLWHCLLLSSRCKFRSYLRRRASSIAPLCDNFKVSCLCHCL